MKRKATAAIAAGLFLAAVLAGCASVPPPVAELDAAEHAVRHAAALGPRGSALQVLTEARQRLDSARDAGTRGRHAEALAAARQAEAAAQHAAALARRATLAAEVESKAARNADLRRRLLIQGN